MAARVMECGDSSPLSTGDLSPSKFQSAMHQVAASACASPMTLLQTARRDSDGDKSPAQSGENSPHSQGCAPSRLLLSLREGRRLNAGIRPSASERGARGSGCCIWARHRDWFRESRRHQAGRPEASNLSCRRGLPCQRASKCQSKPSNCPRPTLERSSQFVSGSQRTSSVLGSSLFPPTTARR